MSEHRHTLPADDARDESAPTGACELSAWLDGAAADPEAVALRLSVDESAARAIEAYRAVDRGLAALADPPADRARQARLIDALVARQRGAMGGRRLARAAGVAAAASLIALVSFSRPALRAPLVLAGAPVLAEPPGVASLAAALATPTALHSPGWVRRLELDPAARRELVARASASSATRELALAWWAIRPELFDATELAHRAHDDRAFVALAVRAVAVLPPSDGAALATSIGRSAPYDSELEQLFVAVGRRRGVAFADELVELARRSKILPAATAALDAMGSAALDAVARRLDRDPHGWTILEQSSHEHAEELLVRAAFASRGRWRAVRALEARWTPALGSRLVALVADPEVAVVLAARIAETDEGAALLVARYAHPSMAGSPAAGVVLRALGRSSTPGATDALERLLGRSDVGHLACAALVEQDLPRSRDALARALASRRLDRAVFEAALVDHPAPRAVALLAEACRDAAGAREITPGILAAGDPRLLPVYRALLDQPARAADALRAVARCASLAATDQLIAALERPALKSRAHRFLVRRTGQNLAPDAETWRAWRGREPRGCG